MANSWDADYEIGDDEAAALIDSQFPDLAPVRLSTLGAGWDNSAFVVNDTYVFRFPRRAMAVEYLEIECRWLPTLAPSLPLPVPAALFVGASAGGYPYPFAGYRMLPGATTCRAQISEIDRAAFAAPLARFLRALHSIPVDSNVRAEAPGDRIRRADISMRAPHVARRIDPPCDALGIDPAPVRALIESLAGAPPATTTCWVHGDLYARHLLVDNGALAGVIDWGDMHVGDPALDLSIAYSFLPATAREAFYAAYGSVDDATKARARFRALHYASVMLPYGRDLGDDAINQVGIDALRFALEE